MKRIRKLGLEAALAAATAAFVAMPASAVEPKTGRLLTRRVGSAPRRRARAGPFAVGKRAKIRVGMWRPANSGSEDVTVEVRVLDALSGQVLHSIKKPLQSGKGQLVDFDPPSEKRLVAFETELAEKLQTSTTSCDEKLTFRVSFDIIEGDDRVHESRQIWPCIRGGFIRQ